MKSKIKQILSVALCMTMIVSSTLPSLAVENDAVQETTESKIVEQLKEDLGEERAEEILSGKLHEEEELSTVNESVEENESEENLGENDNQEIAEASDGDEIVEASTESPDEDSEPEEYAEESVNMDDLSEPEEDEIEVNEESENLNSEEELESVENYLNDETIITESKEIESNEDKQNNINIQNTEISENDEKVATISNTNKIELKKIPVSTESETKMFGNSGNTHYLNSVWYNETAAGVLKKEVTKITFQDGGTAPTSYSATFDVDGLTAYILNGTEVVVYIPNGHTIKLDQYSNGAFSFGTFNSTLQIYESSLTTIVNLNLLDTSESTNMSSLFEGNNKLTSLDLSNFNTEHVTSMNSMFRECERLTSIDISTFNTENVTNMSLMFYNCKKVTDLNFTGFNTTNVTAMSSMFSSCESLTSLDLSSFNTEKVTQFNATFQYCNNLESIDISGFDTSEVTTMAHMFYGCKKLTSINVTNFDTSKVSNFSNFFSNCLNLTSIVGLSNIDTSSATNLNSMFYHCEKLTDIDISHFDTSSAINISYMFTCCYNLENLSLFTTTTEHVSNMRYMFYECVKLQDLDLSGFDTSSTTDMYQMFYKCTNLQSLNISNFDMSNVNYDNMMYGCGSLNTINISASVASVVNNLKLEYDWRKQGSATIYYYDTINNKTTIPNEAGTYERATDSNRVTIIFDTDGGTYVSSQTVDKNTLIVKPNDPTKDNSLFVYWYKDNINNEFDWSTPVNESFTLHAKWEAVTIITSYWYIKNGNELHFSSTTPTDPAYTAGQTFSNFDSQSTIPWEQFSSQITKVVIDNELNLTSTNRLFYGLTYMTTIDNISNLKTNNVVTMYNMFHGCGSLQSIDLSAFDTSQVRNMIQMFYGCGSLTSINLSSFNTNNVTMMSGMFAGCSSLGSIDLSNFNVSKVLLLNSLFSNCNSLTSINLNGFDTSNATSMSSMFTGCNLLTSLDLSSFDTQKVNNMANMFSGCNSLQTIYVSNNFNTSYVTNSGNMFSNCTSLVGGNGTIFNSGHKDKEYARIDGGPTSATPGYFTLAGGAVPTLSGITVNTQSTKVKYKVGETFDPTGLKINLNYSDSSTTIVTYNSTTSSDFTFSPSTAFDTAGSAIPVTVTYSGKNCIQNVEVIEPQSISIKTAPTKVKYAIGETFDPTGLKINLIYSDTTTVEEVTYAGNASDFSFSPSSALNTAGASIPITITYTRNGNNFDCIQNVEVVELSTITINTPPTKTRYIKGTSFDPTGLKINLNYSDSTTDIVEYNTTTSSGFTFNGASTLTLNTLGNSFEVTIGYAGKTTTQNVVVAELDSIEIATHATKLNYMSGDTFDPTGMVIRLTYSDSITETVAYNSTTSSSFTFSPSNPLTRTGNVITVTYGGKSATETLNVKELTGVTIATNPTKLSYATGQLLNPTGLVLTLTYTDSNNANSNENITYNNTTQSKFVFNPSGTAITTGNVTVTYDGKTGAGMQPTFAITVRTVASISVINRPNKTSYSSGNKLALSGLSIKVNYTDGTNETVAYSSNNANDFTFSPSTSTSLNTGHNSVTVTYGGKTTSFAISVTQSSGGYVPSNGGGSSGGSGGGGGGGGIPAGTNPLNNTPATTQVSQGKSISGVVNSDTSTWTSDPLSGKYKLNILDASGNQVPVSNGFYMVTNTVTQVVNNVPIQTQVNNTYYFDTQGNMVTGWVQTADNKWFFFENAKTADEGKMSLGWKQVQGSWYYFTPDGSMMENGITPDGFIIGADGRWVG